MQPAGDGRLVTTATALISINTSANEPARLRERYSATVGQATPFFSMTRHRSGAFDETFTFDDRGATRPERMVFTDGEIFLLSSGRSAYTTRSSAHLVIRCGVPTKGPDCEP
jgi:hypothetical protein